MSLYDLPEIKKMDFKRIFKKRRKKRKKSKKTLFDFIQKNFSSIILVVIFSAVFGFLAGGLTSLYFYQRLSDTISNLGIYLPGETIIEKETVLEKQYTPELSEEKAVIETVKEVSPSVVSIIVTKELPVVEQYWYSPFEEFEFMIPEYRKRGTEKREIGGGTGFIVTKDGLVVTNKHVVADTEAEYTVLTNEGEKYEAEVLARDPVQDLAVLKIKSDEEFKPVKLGDSSTIQIGQTAIAIGNALGEFRNTVSVGVISGLGRTIRASGGGVIEVLEDVIQTDAAISRGNSGGPLLNLKSEVIGINTAMAIETGAQDIGFAIPINKVKRAIEQVKETGKIVYPFLGIRYILVNEQIQEENDLSVDYGAWIVGGEGEPGVVPGSAADKAGLKEGDVVLEFNNERITQENSLAKIIMKYIPGDKVVLLILRGGKTKIIQATLGERSS